MSHTAIQTIRSRALALDEFLPERVFDLGVHGDGEQDRSNMDLLSPNDVRLDPIGHVHHPPAAGVSPVKENSAQLWPMLAAGLVALGVSLLVLTMFAKYLNTVV